MSINYYYQTILYFSAIKDCITFRKDIESNKKVYFPLIQVIEKKNLLLLLLLNWSQFTNNDRNFMLSKFVGKSVGTAFDSKLKSLQDRFRLTCQYRQLIFSLSIIWFASFRRWLNVYSAINYNFLVKKIKMNFFFSNY